jgi:hypothetical protein
MRFKIDQSRRTHRLAAAGGVKRTISVPARSRRATSDSHPSWRLPRAIAAPGLFPDAGWRKVGEFLELPAKPCDSKPPMMGMPGFLTLPKCAYAPSGALS